MLEETRTYIEKDEAKSILRSAGAPEEYINLLDTLPEKSIRIVVKASWIPFLDGDSIMPKRYYRCSRCGRVERSRELYCHCGALMQYNENAE